MGDGRRKAGRARRKPIGAHWPHQKARHADPLRVIAERALFEAIRTGVLAPQPCGVCGEVETEGHHDDYTQPLMVRWLCRAHHNDFHGKRGRVKVYTKTKADQCEAAKPFILALTQQLRDEMDRQQLTQRELAERMGIAQPNLVRIFGGGLKTIASWWKVADALGYSLNVQLVKKGKAQVA